MKKFITLTAAVLLATIFTASADEKREVKTETTTVRIKTPVFEFGNPDEVNVLEIEKLKNVTEIKAPEFKWGNPEDVNTPEVELLKVKAPAFLWGSPEDVNVEELKLLKK